MFLLKTFAISQLKIKTHVSLMKSTRLKKCFVIAHAQSRRSSIITSVRI